MAKKEKEHSAFDTIIAEVMSDAGSSFLLEESMSKDIEKINRVPLRYRIIALGFVRHFTLEELNERLVQAGCAKLYSRSIWEAGLIYAFLHRMSYSEWKELQQICLTFRDEQDPSNGYFQSNTISMEELRRYLEDNSTEDDQIFRTRHLTRFLQNRIEQTAVGQESFRQFLAENVQAFSSVREKTRYYFCKYLYYMLVFRAEQYAAALEKGLLVEDAFSDVLVFKGYSQLKRKKHTPQEAKDFLMNADLSCGEIFDAFNYFYFEYVSLDWMQVLLEYYGNIASLPDSAKQTLAEHLRRYDPTQYEAMSDEQVLDVLQEAIDADEKAMDELYSLDGSNRGYQHNRSGENTIRKYIRGSLDIDRTTLICFLLFFGNGTELPENDRITRGRLTDILLECGFPGLREEDDFDYFVIQYLDAEDPVGYLMEEVTNYAFQEENFYLYRVYQSSVSYNDYFEKLTLGKKKK